MSIKLLLLFLVSAALLRSAFAEPATVTQDTYGVFDSDDIPSLLHSDRAAIEDLVRRHKCILVPKDTTGSLFFEGRRAPPNFVLFQPKTNSNIRVYIPASNVMVGGKQVKVDDFKISDLPRAPIHTAWWRGGPSPARGTSSQMPSEYVFRYNQRHPEDPIEGVSYGDIGTIYPRVTQAIMKMLHLSKFGEDPFDTPYLMVCYGPVPEGDHWYYEVQFRLRDSSYVLPAGKIWTAIIRESRTNRVPNGSIRDGEIISCELGMDIPTLKDGEFPPLPADQMKAYQTRVAIERILDPLRSLDIPPKIPKGEVTILENTLGIVDDFGVMLRGVEEFRTLITAQYFDDKKTLDALFEQGKGHFVLIKKGTRVILRNPWPPNGEGLPSDGESRSLQVIFHGQRRRGESGQEGWSDYYLRLPVSALLKEFSHPAIYDPKSNDWVISNESQERWLKNPGSPGPTPAPTPQELPESPLAPAPTPTPDWKGMLVGTLGVYDMAWRALPNQCKIKIHDEEVQFRESMKSLDDKTKIKKLEERIPYLEAMTREANTPKTTPNPNTAAYTVRPSTPEEIAEESTLRQEYSAAFMALPASTRRQLRNAETDFEIKTRNEDGAARNTELRERIKYFQSLAQLDAEEPRNLDATASAPTAAPNPTPKATPQSSAQSGINFLVEEYDKMWQAAYAAQPESARAKLRDEENAFRASLNGLDANTVLQKLANRMMYFQTLSVKLTPIPPVPPSNP